MSTTLTTVLQSERGLKVDEVYWITTHYERQVDYIYEGVTNDIHRFFRNGAIKDCMRRISVLSRNLRIEGKDVKILNDEYKLDGVDKEESPKEYLRLQKLWGSKNVQ